jgi:hypothetical protein
MHGPLKSPFHLVRLFYENFKSCYNDSLFWIFQQYLQLYDHFFNTKDFPLNVM